MTKGKLNTEVTELQTAHFERNAVAGGSTVRIGNCGIPILILNPSQVMNVSNAMADEIAVANDEIDQIREIVERIADSQITWRLRAQELQVTLDEMTSAKKQLENDLETEAKRRQEVEARVAKIQVNLEDQTELRKKILDLELNVEVRKNEAREMEDKMKARLTEVKAQMTNNEETLRQKESEMRKRTEQKLSLANSENEAKLKAAQKQHDLQLAKLTQKAGAELTRVKDESEKRLAAVVEANENLEKSLAAKNRLIEKMKFEREGDQKLRDYERQIAEMKAKYESKIATLERKAAKVTSASGSKEKLLTSDSPKRLAGTPAKKKKPDYEHAAFMDPAPSTSKKKKVSFESSTLGKDAMASGDKKSFYTPSSSFVRQPSKDWIGLVKPAKASFEKSSEIELGDLLGFRKTPSPFVAPSKGVVNNNAPKSQEKKGGQKRKLYSETPGEFDLDDF